MCLTDVEWKQIIFSLLLILAPVCDAKHDNPVEVGYVKWGRNYLAGKDVVAKTGKPMLLFFQEVPG